MKSSTFIVAVGLAAAAVGLSAGAGLAQGPSGPSGVIAERANLMKQQAGDLGVVHSYVLGKATKAKAEAAAADLTDTTRKIPTVFPGGSGGTSPGGKFGTFVTKPEIWSDWQGFLAAQKNAVQKAFALEAAVKTGNKQKIGAAFADLFKNGCTGCHTKFREQIKK